MNTNIQGDFQIYISIPFKEKETWISARQQKALKGKLYFCFFPLWSTFHYHFHFPVAQRCSAKKMFLKILQNPQKNTCAGVSILINLQAEACNFIKKETLTQVFSCEFCEISKNTFS